MDRHKRLGIRMDPRMVLKLRIMGEALVDDVIELLSQSTVKAVLWLLSIIVAFVAGLAF